MVSHWDPGWLTRLEWLASEPQGSMCRSPDLTAGITVFTTMFHFYT